MKSPIVTVTDGVPVSRPTRGAWIEIKLANAAKGFGKSRPTRGAWIEIISEAAIAVGKDTSRPTRGAWIEIC